MMQRVAFRHRLSITLLCAIVSSYGLQSQRCVGQSLEGTAVSVNKNLTVEQLVAWCIVPFDAGRRGPKQRAQMLTELGIKRLAYDWREEHVPTWDAELDALDEAKIELTAFWCSSSLTPANDPSTQRIINFLARRGRATQLWVMLPDGELAKLEDEQQRVRVAAAALRELADQVREMGCSVGLYNHGGWVGQPSAMVAIMRELKGTGNVGIVYNFHHAHEDLEAFPGALRDMKPYLMCLNLNGTTVGGPKILPLGEGERDCEILNWIKQSQYDGPIGILDHRDDVDAKESLRQNLDGLKRLLGPEN